MKFQGKLKKRKNQYRPMFSLLPRKCRNCGLCIWLEWCEPATMVRYSAVCEKDGELMFPFLFPF